MLMIFYVRVYVGEANPRGDGLIQMSSLCVLAVSAMKAPLKCDFIPSLKISYIKALLWTKVDPIVNNVMVYPGSLSTLSESSNRSLFKFPLWILF